MTTTWAIAAAILASSFFGSWHCAAMCSPISSLMGTRKSLWSYNLGRLFAYMSLGAIAGTVGQFFLNSDFVWLRIASTILFAAVLFSMGLRLLFPEWSKRYLPLLESHGILNLYRIFRKFHLNQSGFVVGTMTAFLPCGWLYTYVTAAIATKNPTTGTLIMFLFWLGGLPALSVLPSMIRTALARTSYRQQRIGGGLLVIASLYSLFSFMWLH